ncbi:hypothetical protein L861_17865 [Litchfieldella anticariensis FP35 = DSM 16096]|uniref:Exlusion protein FxsA n=1 Tax=Litchfieldella anticariensis (strain DSM 16096 / CECT 5854 / CIP 108499 / LMG 22089 / FP35) TaxID=1121939 RepID=S2KNB4_LITA3|nr:FxsA family protein [Halomonas anticariensis]EPC03405.1 hypothetical protein L861_17865 [Halomonas anticariensis FP35 = DSM 16096]
MPFLLLFTLFALLDFVVLFAVGSHIGLLTTLLLVLATGFIGLHLIRREGVATFQRAQQRLAQGELPSDELLTGAALIFGGALLMAPGFLSDALGFMCLIPNARGLLGKLLTRTNVLIRRFHYRHGQASGNDWHAADEDPSHSHHAPDHEDDSSHQPLEGDFISKDEPHR